MIDLGTNFDGTVEKAVESAKTLSGKWKIVQDFMLAGDFETGLAKKINGNAFGDTTSDPKNFNRALIDNYAAQLATLDESAQRVVLKATKLNGGIQTIIQSTLDATAAGKKMNSVLFEQTAGQYQAKEADIDTMMFIGQMKDNNGIYPSVRTISLSSSSIFCLTSSSARWFCGVTVSPAVLNCMTPATALLRLLLLALPLALTIATLSCTA